MMTNTTSHSSIGSSATPHGVSASRLPRAGAREWAGLAVLALPALLVSVDIFMLLLALPQINASLGASATQQLWILDIYGFMLAGCMVTMGTLGDRIGRRKLLLQGAAAFGLASVLAACSTSAPMLIAARALLGVAGATLAPSTLALISTMFRDPRERATAISVWLVCFIGGATLGPLVGGVVLAHFPWGAVFLLGVPAMLLLLVLGPWLLPEDRDPAAGRLDLPSVVLSLAALLPLVYGLKELARSGPGLLPVVAALLGVASAVVFVRRQWTLTHPLLDLRLFADRALSTALGSLLLGTGLTGATLVFITQHLQLTLGLTPLQAGVWMVPAMAASILSFQLAPRLARRIRPAPLIAAGLGTSVVGLLLLTQVGGSALALPTLVTGFALVNFGAGPLVALGTALVVGSAPVERAGSAAALSETSSELGFALGIATLGSLGTAVYRAQIAEHLPTGVSQAVAQAAQESFAGAVSVAERLPHAASAALLGPAREAFTGSLHAAAAVGALLLIGVALLVLTRLREVRPLGEPPDQTTGA